MCARTLANVVLAFLNSQKELHDRASDPTCADTLQLLSTRLFDGYTHRTHPYIYPPDPSNERFFMLKFGFSWHRWDPVAITARAAERKNEAQLLGKWQGNVKPEQTHVWRIEP